MPKLPERSLPSEPDFGSSWCAVLSRLGPDTIITEAYLASLRECNPVTIKRAVGRGELPVPVRLFGEPTWTVGAIVKHVEARLQERNSMATSVVARNRR
jgi:hypothetical protein